MRLKDALKVIVSVSAVLLGMAVGTQVIEYQQAVARPKPPLTQILPSPQPTAHLYGTDNPVPDAQNPPAESAISDISTYPAPVTQVDPPAHSSAQTVPHIVTSVPLTTPEIATSWRLPLNQADAVEKAITLARQYGLQKTRPDSFAVQQMTLNEWNYLVGIESGPDAAKFGLDPNQRVWVITMKGDVVLTGPGSTGEKFDNITIVLNVETAEQKGTFTAGPGQPLPLTVP